MRVSIIGSGYVGLVTGVCLAEKGHKVVCVDLDPAKVRSINAGIPTIRERGLAPLLRRNAGDRLRASSDLAEAVAETDLTLVAVGTPFQGQAIDLSQIRAACAAVGRALRDKDSWHMVVIKSTVVPGTTENEVLPILERGSGKLAGEGFGVGMNPEFLTEGEAVEDFMRPDRLVLGAIDPRSLRALEELYEGFPGVERIRVNCRTAEMIKYASNSLLATLISYSNEIANLCSSLGKVDAMDVVKGMQSSKYLRAPGGAAGGAAGDSAGGSEKGGPAPIADFLVPGCGFGGSCLPKDISALIAHGRSTGASMKVLEAVRDTNLAQPARMIRLLEKHLHDLRGVPITVLGLAFRPGTSDMRESPALPVIGDLLARGARVSAFDPALIPATAVAAHAGSGQAAASASAWEDETGPEETFDGAGLEAGSPGEIEAERAFNLFEGKVKLCRSLEEAAAGARGIVLVTRWDEFRRLPAVLGRIEAGAHPVVVDGRRILDKSDYRTYEGIGL